MGTIKCGFWMTKFLITPNEFENILEICDKYGITFEVTTFERPKHSKENVLVEYKKYYNHVTSMEKINNRIGFVYSVVIPDTLGFHLVSNKFQYSDEVKRFWIDDLYLELSYQKAVAINDETGEYFTYEDINLHYPKGYPIYKEIEDYIKGISKPMRIKINDKVKSFPIRISQNVATDLEQSWSFKENQIEMISYKPKK